MLDNVGIHGNQVKDRLVKTNRSKEVINTFVKMSVRNGLFTQLSQGESGRSSKMTVLMDGLSIRSF